jgi:hypothetical protein
MAKQQTALQELIKYLEKKHDQCQPFSSSIPFLQMAIGEAKDLLKKERGQIESAFWEGFDHPKRKDGTAYLKQGGFASEYYNETF